MKKIVVSQKVKELGAFAWVSNLGQNTRPGTSGHVGSHSVVVIIVGIVTVLILGFVEILAAVPILLEEELNPFQGVVHKDFVETAQREQYIDLRPPPSNTFSP